MAKVATPTASPVAGAQLTAPTVTLTCSTVGSIIFYTTDGTSPTHTAGTPTGTTQIYLTPLVTTLPETIKALGYLAADTDSNVLTAAYAQGYSISGSLGAIGANAIVFFVNAALNPDFNNNAVFVQANASGAYVSGALVSGTTYLVTPAILGLEFSPFNSSQTIASENITGVNFSLGSYYALQAGGGDTFAYSGNLDVENPTAWALNGNTPITGENGFAQASADDLCVENWIGPGYTSPYTGDVWASFKLLTSTAAGGTYVIGLRADTSLTAGTGIWFEVFGTLGAAPTASTVIDILNLADQTNGFFLAADIEFNVGDVILCLARANNYYIFQNGVAIAAITFVSTAAGYTSLCIDNPTTLADTTLQNFLTGAVIASSGPSSGKTNLIAGYGTDISASSEVTTNPAGETNSNRTSIMGTNRGSRFIG